MPDYLLLLRGVNVGGYGRLPMADLRRVLEGLGYRNVSTFLQSGNAVFSTDGADGADGAHDAHGADGADADGTDSADGADGADDAAETARERVRMEIERALARELGLHNPCLLRDRAELRRLIERNPLLEIAHDPARLHVIFLRRPPDVAALAAIDPGTYAPVVLAPGERALYGWYPEGVGHSRLTAAFFEKRLDGGVATMRNWNTVTKLLELMGG